MYGISAALAVTWLSHSSQYILYPGVISFTKTGIFLDPLRQDAGSMMTIVHFVHEDSEN